MLIHHDASARDKVFAQQGLADLIIPQLPSDPMMLDASTRRSMIEADALLEKVREAREVRLPSIFNSHLEFADRLLALGDARWADQVLCAAGEYLVDIDPSERRKEL